MPRGFGRSASAVVLAGLLTACIESKQPEFIVLPPSFRIESADSLWMPCHAIGAQQDSAFHFVHSTSSLSLGASESASLHVWFEDVNDPSGLPRRCEGTGLSGSGLQRTGLYDGTSTGIVFVWDMVPVPDTVGEWVTSEEVFLGPVFRPSSGDEWNGSLTVEGQVLAVLLHPR